MTSTADSVRAAGIVGAGGAGFPTHVKFTATEVDTVIANGAECEPLLRCDKAVMRQRTARVLEGLHLLAEATGADRAVISLKGHYRDTVARVREVAREAYPQIEVHELNNYYPAGDEQVLVNEVTDRVVPEGGIPLQVGVVVSNVITLSQVADAVREGRAVTRRPLTVAGEVARPLTCELPLGAPLSEAVSRAGGATVERWAIVEGGPMMGRVVSPEAPVTKKTSGVIVLPAEHPVVLGIQRSMDREVKLARAVCCQCRMCTDLCPRFNLGHAIRPHLAMRSLVVEGLSAPRADHITAAYLCCLCGVCEVFACPLGLSPRKVFDQIRQTLSAAEQPNPHKRADCAADEFGKRRRIPLPRLIARLGLSDYVDAPDVVELERHDVPSVRIPLSQHLGAPARPTVAQGQTVREGDVIGEIPEGKLGARVHASQGGVVRGVTGREIVIERS